MQTAGSAQAEQRQPFGNFAYAACGQVDVDQSVEFGQYDVDVVRADAGGEDAHPLPLVGAGDGVEFAVGDLRFAFVEVGGHALYPAGIAYQDDGVGQLLGCQM